MSEHRASLRWKRETPGFTYAEYDRSHVVRFGGGLELRCSSAPQFLGRAELVNPEEQLVAALSSCHMLSFLAIAARLRHVVESYVDDAVGEMSKREDGKLWVSRVRLRPRVVFASAVAADKLAEIHRRAHEECFIANSVRTEVTVEATD